jgi:DNA-binding response OmpR family regulator
VRPAANLARPRVAVIDDEEDVLTFVRLLLEDAGFEVLTCDRPTEALPALASFAPDLVCLDLLMPEQLGWSLFAELRRDPALARVPVIILSGCDASAELEHARSLGRGGAEVAYLEKPVEPEALLTMAGRLAGCAPAEVMP